MFDQLLQSAKPYGKPVAHGTPKQGDNTEDIWYHFYHALLSLPHSSGTLSMPSTTKYQCMSICWLLLFASWQINVIKLQLVASQDYGRVGGQLGG
jgi:hypothetical protein